jgi:three-Cys-motif partner protein
LYSDTNAEYTAALNKRLEPYTRKEGYAMFGDSIEVRNTDANEFVKSVPDMLRRHGISHSLVFVDPEGLELRWDSLASMANGCRYADWIILFPSAGLLRLKGRRDDASWERIREFIGPYAADLTHDSSEEDFIEAYRRNLASIGLDSSTEIAVTGTGSFHYHLIPAVRTTKGGSPWFRSMIDVKRRIESMTGETIGVVIQQIEGRMGVL